MAGRDYGSLKERIAHQDFTWAFISSDTTTQITTGPTFLHSISWRNAATTTIDVYDDPDSNDTQCASVDTASASGKAIFNIELQNGLRVVTSGGATVNVTVTYAQ